MIDQKHKGAANELGATLWLLNQGYEVFRNVSQHGDTDLIALRYSRMIRIDVKAASGRTLADGAIKFYPQAKQVAAGVLLLLAYPDGRSPSRRRCKMLSDSRKALLAIVFLSGCAALPGKPTTSGADVGLLQPCAQPAGSAETNGAMAEWLLALKAALRACNDQITTFKESAK